MPPYLKQNTDRPRQIPREKPESNDEEEVDEKPGDSVAPQGLGNPPGALSGDRVGDGEDEVEDPVERHVEDKVDMLPEVAPLAFVEGIQAQDVADREGARLQSHARCFLRVDVEVVDVRMVLNWK